MSAYERSGWRDQEISTRHRVWGVNCPAVDLDFLLLEYNRACPSALVEYKHVGARMPHPQEPSYRALRQLANSAGLPLLIVFYWPDTWAVKVYPWNALARQHFTTGECLSEQEYVMRLYAIRQIILSAGDQAALAKLQTQRPPADAQTTQGAA